MQAAESAGSINNAGTPFVGGMQRLRLCTTPLRSGSILHETTTERLEIVGFQEKTRVVKDPAAMWKMIPNVDK